MRITFVLPGIFIAGGVRAVFECSNRLIERGHEVKIVYSTALLQTRASFSLKRTFKHFVKFLIDLMKANRVEWFELKAKLVKIPYLHAPVIKLFERRIPDADVVVATSWESAYAVSRLAPLKGKKAYFVQHYEITDIYDDGGSWKQLDEEPGKGQNPFLRFAKMEPKDKQLRRYKQKVDGSYRLPLAKFTTSLLLSDLITSGFGQRVFGRAPIGNNLDIFHPEGKKAGNNLILMPFRGTGWKGGLDGLEALKLIRSEIKDIKVISYGASMYAKYIPEWIDFRGIVSDAELRQLYTMADIFISPTWIEGWSSPQMEAMSCGTACVTTNVGAVPEYAVNDRTALIVPPRDPKKLAEAVIKLLKDPAKRDSIACAGHEHIQSYTWDRTVEEMEKILRKIHQEC